MTFFEEMASGLFLSIHVAETDAMNDEGDEHKK